MNVEELFKGGQVAFNPDHNVYEINPYKRIDNFREDVQGFQIEATPFFNGWEAARRLHDKSPVYSIFLDDFRFPNWINWVPLPSTHWTITRHYYDFVSTIEQHGVPVFISWDYDLDLHGLEHIKKLEYKTGLDCAKWLVEYCEKNNIPFPRAQIHSQSPTGAPRIYEFLRDYFVKKNIPL